MNKELYNKIIYSIDKEVKSLIKEQFNIGNMDLSGTPKDQHGNIFNKNIYIADPKIVYKKILFYPQNVTNDDISSLNERVSIYKITSKKDLQTIIKFYSSNYNDASLNWLNVSAIKDFSDLFCNINFNGDISKWNVSNVTNMYNMFYMSTFNGDISEWDVSKVKNMSSMF